MTVTLKNVDFETLEAKHKDHVLKDEYLGYR